MARDTKWYISDQVTRGGGWGGGDNWNSGQLTCI